MFFSTDYIPGVDEFEYCGFTYCPLAKGMFSRNAFKEGQKMMESLGGNAMIGTKMLSHGDTLYIYGTVVRV